MGTGADQAEQLRHRQVVSTALPLIIGSLNGTQTQYTWVVTATLLTATVTTPIWGKLADLFNKKTLVQVAIVIFVLGSMISGLSQNTEQLIAARAFQVAGVGVGMTMRNLVLAVQNAVPLRDLGSAGASVTFFRSLGGTIGVSVLGAVLANRVAADLAAALRTPAGATSAGNVSALNPHALPPEVQQAVHTVYGDAIAHVFLISAGVAVVGVIAALLLKPITLRTTIDLEKKDASADQSLFPA